MIRKMFPPNGAITELLLQHFPEGYQGWGVDVGASDGVSINTTYNLESAFRWNILSVEANPEFEESLKKHRMFVEMCACGELPAYSDFHINTSNPEAFSSLRPTNRKDILENPKWVWEPVQWTKVRVRVERLEDLLKKWQFPQLDLLCVDTEGTELEVLKGCDLAKWKPKVIVTECWDEVGPIDPYLEALGYKKTDRNVHNDIFVRGDE